MAYIGHSASGNFTTKPSKDTFSGDGSTTAFTLSEGATTNTVDVFVENVRQEPTTAYTVDGTTLTFTAAPGSGTNNIYVVNRGPLQLSATHPAAQALEASTGTFTGTLSGVSATFTGDLTVDTNTLHVDSTNNRVGVGTVSPTASLDIPTGGIRLNSSGADANSKVGNFGVAGFEGYVEPYDSNAFTNIVNTVSSKGITFQTGGSERMRVDSSGRFLFGKTASSNSVGGVEMQPVTSTSSSFWVVKNTTGSACIYLNRTSSAGDGSMVFFASDETVEGNISVSGTTVSYNGGHLSRWSQLTDGTKDTSIVKGTVMTNLDQMAVWAHDAVEATYYVDGDELPETTPATYYTEDDTLPDGVSVGDEKTAAVFAQVGDEKTPAKDAYTENNEQLNCMAVSSVEGDANVAGVFVNWDNDDDGFNDMNVAMTGDMVIRIAQGTTVARGDLLMSAGDGTAKPQGDDIVRSKTIAKVTSTQVSHTYDDGTYLVPCVLMAC